MIDDKARPENEIFSDIEALCASPGSAEAIARLCLRDNIIRYKNSLSGEAFARMRGSERLIRNEINALIGCLVKSEDGFKKADYKTIAKIMEDADRLLAEIHSRMNLDAYAEISIASIEAGEDPTKSGEALREAVYYAAESAYVFQFRDMAALRYAKDTDWIKKSKGFEPEDARKICAAIFELQHRKLGEVLRASSGKNLDEIEILAGFQISHEEISATSSVDGQTVLSFLKAFSVTTGNQNLDFKAVDDFNLAAVQPIVSDPQGAMYLFQYYPLVESNYDSPFYWFSEDKAYFPTALKNRGDFTEDFLRQRLEAIFGKQAVFPNVELYEGKNRVGEIDCLVVYGEYALIFQAKSQRLTLQSRKGKIARLQEDFQKAVQKAYDQAASCADALSSKTVRVVYGQDGCLDLSQIEWLYPVCVLADHYPSLAMQARAFLKPRSIKKLGPPLVCDLFLMDVMTEMLPSPLRFISYITLRAVYGEKLLVTNELATFGFYLRQSLFVEGDTSMMMLDDSVASDLDAAMTVRREGLPGPRVPKGVLTRLANTRLGKIASIVEHDPNQFSVGLGLSIFEMGEDSIKKMSLAIDQMIRDSGRTGKQHDLTIPLPHRDAGLTIHVNDLSDAHADSQLRAHMLRRKYSQRAKHWYGLVLEPHTGKMRFGAKASAPYAFDFLMEANISGAMPMTKIEDFSIHKAKARKVERNDLCPCGSGRKFKKCCML